MNLITIIVIFILIWLIYSILNSYNSLQMELREIRMKCIAGGGNIDQSQFTQNPMTNMKQNLINGLNKFI